MNTQTQTKKKYAERCGKKAGPHRGIHKNKTSKNNKKIKIKKPQLLISKHEEESKTYKQKIGAQ